MVKPTYRFSFIVYYTIANLILDAYLANQAAFAAHSPLFTVLFATNLRTALNDALAMPDITARRAALNLLLGQLKAQNLIMCKDFLALKGFITKAFPTTKDTQFQLAGQAYFPKASNRDWESTLQMDTMIETYVTANSTALQANNNMPTNFLTNFLLKKTDFFDKHFDYKNAQENALLATDAKRTAFNVIDIDIKAICKVALLLGFDETTLKLFNMTYLETLVSGAGSSSLKGTIYSFLTGQYIPFATLKIINAPDPTIIGLTITADAKGKYTIPNLPHGDYYLQITAPAPTTGNPYHTKYTCIPIPKRTATLTNFQLRQQP